MDINLPICPACQGTLKYTDCAFDKYDGTVAWGNDYYGEDIVWFSCYGYCKQCGKEYHWREKYSFSGVASMECVGEREV